MPLECQGEWRRWDGMWADEIHGSFSPTASLIICSVVYTRKKKIHRYWEIIHCDSCVGWIMKNTRSCWSMAEQGLKIFKTCLCLCHRWEEKQGRIYFKDREHEYIKRAKPEALCCMNWDIQQKWTKTNFKAKKHLFLCSFTPENFLTHPFLSLLHFKISGTDFFCLFSTQPTNSCTSLVSVFLNLSAPGSRSLWDISELLWRCEMLLLTKHGSKP